ncbi:Vacuole effluxer Atg22 like [Geosmithia morbida]|uniref:Vacuole effluxer Atg22 like n=1 Tax=Geosmithia morbida TaxID=1094350 RepID=A0A9P5D0Y4_9HYPO|nr:Vacuole effluxer Atg22 like [Geosmithia morbida]KAF4119330.1 Vacuole effluxer Atg22 like [Geosmithia morbida]
MSPIPSRPGTGTGHRNDESSHDHLPATEQTPLLLGGGSVPKNGTESPVVVSAPDSSASSSRDDDEGKEDEDVDRPLPRLQIFLLCYARMMDPVAFFSIFPYIAEMVHRVGDVPDTDVGFYSGLIESLFSISQMLVLVGWGRLSDRIGRKPVLLYSFVGLVVSPLLFGMSTSPWQMIAFRCLAGIFSGSGLIIRTMLSELSTPQTQAQAFSWFAFGSNIGIFVGPLIGGALADPVRQYPGVFGESRFFRKYPYALSGFAVAALASTAFVTSALFLEETLDDDKKSSKKSRSKAKSNLSIWEIIKSPGVAIVLWVYNHAMVLAFSYTAVIPVALYTPVALGGLGFGPSSISIVMAIQGASQAIWLILVFPFLQHRVGTKGIMRGCAIGYPFFFASFVVLSTLLRNGSQPAMVLFWILGGITNVIGPGVAMCFTGAQLALNDVAPDHHVLGTLNAIALTVSSGVRSVIPGMASAVFAVGVKHQIFRGHLEWLTLIPLSLAYFACVRHLPEGKRPHRPTGNEREAA